MTITEYIIPTPTTPYAYVHLSEDETILTFYYDTLRDERDGTTWGIGEKKKENFVHFPAWAGTFESPNTTILTAVFDASFRDFRPTTTVGWFRAFLSLIRIKGLEHLNTSQVTDMSGMFNSCSSLTSIDFSSFDTSKVTNMNRMFSGCSSLTSLDLSSFDTSKVTDMSCMFWSCKSLTSIDFSSFDTSQVTSMSKMFFGCSSLRTLDLSNFDTSKVTSMGGMFSGCFSLTSLDLSSFDTSKVTSMEGMFRACSSLTALDLSRFDTSDVKHMWRMFDGCSSLTSLDLSNFDTSKVTSMSSWKQGMFSGCSALTTLDLSSFDTSRVMDMSRMFEDCSSLTSLDLSSFDTSQVTDMSYMFSGCKSLITIYCKSSWNCDSSANMFTGCVSLSGAATYEKGRDDVSMANPQTGYFTKNVLTKENGAYVLLTADKKTLTFYFDRKRNFHKGDCWLIEGTTGKDDNKISLWADCAKKI